jgi:Ni/Co efflux regulator RcnB
MRTQAKFPTLLLAFTLALGAPLAFSQTRSSDTGTAKQDMKDAGHQSKDAARDAGHGVKKGTTKAYHSTKRVTKKAWNKTANTTKGAIHGGKEGAKQPD